MLARTPTPILSFDVEAHSIEGGAFRVLPELTAAVSAAVSQIEIADGILPREVQWMPPSRQVVQPMGFDAPFEMEVTPAIAAAADRQLQQLRSKAAAGEDVEPYGDFNHEDKARSFLPRRFFRGGDHPKSGGVRMELDWTGAGAKAVLNGEQNVISASWILHKINRAFLGIKHNVGGLVPRSAFHSIQAFAKAGAPPLPSANPALRLGNTPQRRRLDCANTCAAWNGAKGRLGKSAGTSPESRFSHYRIGRRQDLRSRCPQLERFCHFVIDPVDVPRGALYSRPVETRDAGNSLDQYASESC